MDGKALHVVNGDSLSDQMKELNLPGQVVVWREMLCEGPTIQQVESSEFLNLRKKFFQDQYHVTPHDYEEKFVRKLDILATVNGYDHIVLWFEFDLFCHINMLAAITFLMENKAQVPMYLVCSKKLKGDNELKPLSQLNLKQLEKHYNHKIGLSQEDMEIAMLIWELYCSKNPMQLKPQIKTNSNFEYLSSCIRAHIERFPNSTTGINSLERNILKLINEYTITSYNQFIGYALQYQGYYGYNDIQMQRVLKKLRRFYITEENTVQLSEKGIQALKGSKNFYQELKTDERLGGALVYDFLYQSESHRLLKL